MGTALQQLPRQRRQQEQVRPEPTGQQIPSRSSSQPPSADEHYAHVGNQDRCELAGARLEEDTPAEGATPGEAVSSGSTMGSFRADSPDGRPEDVPFHDGFMETADMFHLWAGGCASGLAQLEEEAHRWYFLGRLPPDYEAGCKDYKQDMASYASFSLEARGFGTVIDATRAMASHALSESDALRLMLVEQGAARMEDGRLVLDPARVTGDLAAVREGFERAGIHAEGQVEEFQMLNQPSALLGQLGVGVAAMNAVVADLRARAAARRAEVAQDELDKINELIEDCAAVADIAANACTLGGGGLALAGGLTAVEGAGASVAGMAGEKALGVLGGVLDPGQTTTAGLKALFDERIKRLEANVVAFEVLEGAEHAAGRQQAVEVAAGQLMGATMAVSAWREQGQATTDSYLARAANLGSEADERLRRRGVPTGGGGGVGAAAARRAS
ncbi:MAG: hypothetical protein ABIO70_12810, partial [Pseudomonadota bacterium]